VVFVNDLVIGGFKMKSIAFTLSGIRPVRFLVGSVICALIFFSNAFPAAAISSPKSAPEDSTTQLLETQKKTDEITTEPPPGLEEVKKKANEGINEIQGGADKDKMKRPENTQGATSVEDNILKTLEKF
jgi:hypothetical protein